MHLVVCCDFLNNWFGSFGTSACHRHAHYQAGNTPLTLVWKDDKCSQYVIDTDSKGEIPSKQQVYMHL